MHSSQKKSSRWELSYSNHGPPALPPQKRKGKKFRQLNCYYKLWIIIFGSFFAPSLCHLLPKPDFSLQELGMGRKEQGGPDIWNVSYPACTPFLPWPRPAAPHHSILWGYPERMPWGNEQQTLPWEAAFMPPLPPPISLPREPFLARHVQILCLLTVRPSSGVKPQSGLGERFIFLHWNALRWTALPPVE